MSDKKDSQASNSAYPSALNVVSTNTVTDTKVVSPPWYYSLVIKLLKPVYRLVLWRRYQKAKKNEQPVADYQQEIDARYGRHYPDAPALTYQPKSQSNLNSEAVADKSLPDSVFKGANIWCHAVSLGETNTIAPMLKVMLQQGARLWITNTTQTGFARTEALFAEHIASQQVVHTFVPIDDKSVIKKFIEKAKPDLAMFVETELWANILAVLKQAGIPSVLVNARLSQKSYENYAKYESVTKSMMHNISMIIAQDADSAKRFRRFGTEVVKIRRADSLKWSTGPANSASKPNRQDTAKRQVELQQQFSNQAEALNRPIWVAGSTHEGEEKAVIEAHKQLMAQSRLANALLIIVPRHPERFDAVAELLEQSDVVYHRRSQQQLIESDTQIYLADTMGELTSCYELCDVALVGGSLINIGGHNPIEAASLAKPIIMGPYTQSCHEVVAALNEAGALTVVEAIQQGSKKSKNKHSHASDTLVKANLTQSVSHWLSHPEVAKQAGEQGQKLVNSKSDAMQKQLAMIENLLNTHLHPPAAYDPKQDEVDLDHFKVRKRGEGEA